MIGKKHGLSVARWRPRRGIRAELDAAGTRDHTNEECKAMEWTHGPKRECGRTMKRSAREEKWWEDERGKDRQIFGESVNGEDWSCRSPISPQFLR